MRIIILLCGVMIYLAVMLLLGKSAEKNKQLSNRLLAIEKQGEIETVTEDDMDRTFFDRILRPGVSKVIRFLSAILPVNEKSAKVLSERLRQSGSSKTAREYLATNIVVIAFAAAGMFLLSRVAGMSGKMTLYLIGITIFAVYTIARFRLSGNITKRKNKIENALPDVLDLLSVSVSAGLGFDQALLYVVERCDGPLVDELAIAQKEISLGRARTEALKRMAARCDVSPLNIFVSAIIQADTLGIPIANVLSTQADNIRNLHRQKIEERAAKLPVKILIPLVLLVFPNLFVVILGPAVPRVISAFGGMG